MFVLLLYFLFCVFVCLFVFKPGCVSRVLIVDTVVCYLYRFVSIGNLTGIPCLVLPVGYDKKGLPVALQIMGRWWEDHVILRVGNILEQYTKEKLQKPQVYNDYFE